MVSRVPGTRRPVLAVAAVTTLAGLIFTANAQLARNTAPESPLVAGRQPQHLAELVAVESARVAELTERASSLSDEIDGMVEAIAPVGISEDTSLALLEATAIGFIPVSGPGVTVVLYDAPSSAAMLAGIAPDDLVIHQQDLQAVVAALWAGGAEAMTLMGERVTMTSAFRCTGNVLLLHGQVFSPPYVVRAIGDPDRLERAVMASPGVRVFLSYVDALGLGFSLTQEAELQFPAYAGAASLRFAGLLTDVEPWRVP